VLEQREGAFPESADVGCEPVRPVVVEHAPTPSPRQYWRRRGVSERAEVVVVGGGQAGLTAGYYLRQAEVPFLILDAASRGGDSWRERWDSLVVFTCAAYSELPELPFPGDPERFPGKDEVADYLET